MAVAPNFSPVELLNSTVSLAAAFVLGALIGAERQYRQRTAGLRTNVLVALGASAFVDMGMRLTGHPGAVQVLSYVVSGVGFLGAGVIMKEGLNVRGLNTAATLWCSAAVGAFAGADLLAEAVLLTAAVLSGNTLLRPLVNAINRIPIDARQIEATYEMRVTVRNAEIDEVRAVLADRLTRANYPVRDIELEDRDAQEVELVATLVSTTVEPRELDAVAAAMTRVEGVEHAAWSSRTVD